MSSTNFNAEKILEFLAADGKIDLSDVQERMNKKQRENYIFSVHPYKIYQAADGRWRTHIADTSSPEKRKVVAKTSRDTLYEFLYDHYNKANQSSEDITLRSLYPDWLEYKRLHTNAETYISRIETDWKTYYTNTSIVEIPIVRLDKLTLDTWAHKLIQDNNMTKTQYYNVTVIMRQMLLYAVDKELLESSPFSKVKIDGKRLFRKAKKKPDYTQVFLKEEIEPLCELAWEDFKAGKSKYKLAPLAVIFQMQTGLRIGEVCAVTYQDIEHEDYIHIQRMLRRDTSTIVNHTKTDCGDREVYLTQKARKLITTAKEYQKNMGLDSNGYIFSVSGEPLPEHAVAYLYRKYCKKMGIIQKSSHKARKTYISSLIDGQININTIREMAGHSDERTTLKNYVFDRSTPAEKKAKIEAALC